ncbi:hypothetical protein HK102_008923 [Quaeritorhiza haematococci]|nr:hypothetical protein HK102_008923 [Quaeritorhiza haematococci]
MAQMILHQETISVAESLLKNISDQLLGADEDLSWEQKSSWSQCLREEITENEELKTSIWNGWYEGNVAYSAVRLLDEVVHLEKDIGLRRSKRLRTLKRGHASNPSSNNNSGSSSSSGST